MLSLLRNRISFIWILLVSATVVSWAMGHGVGLVDGRNAGVAIIIIAFIKVRFVILDFMEIRHAPLFMRLVGEAWVVGVCTTLIVLYERAPH